MKIIKIFVIFLFSSVFLSSCENVSEYIKSSAPSSFERFQMGTIVTQSIFSNEAEKIASEVFDQFDSIENKMTAKKDIGEISEINKKAGYGTFIKVSDDTFFVLEKGIFYNEKSNNAFNIALGPIINTWAIGSENPRIPAEEEIVTLLKKTHIKDIILDTSTKSARLKEKGQSIDLGGIAKGYAGDVAIEMYKKAGVKSALVNLGGNVVAMGKKPDGSNWKIGVQDPRDVNGRYIGILSVSDSAVVTSGDYERFFEKDGKKYHHIIDGNTGYPSNSGLIGVTIVCKSSVDADCLSTSAFILGLEKGMKLVESLNAGGIFITEDKKVYVSKNLAKTFEKSADSEEYQYVENR